MNRLLSVVLPLAILLAVAACETGDVPERRADLPRPNILWISVEDMSPRVGAYGDSIAMTPNIDRLATEGVRYTQVFATYGVCAPARSSLITGMYPMSIGTHQMRTTTEAPGLPGPYLAVPPPEVKAFSEYLRAAGYYCTNDVKTDYQFAPVSDSRQPLTAWDESRRGADWRGRAAGQPFFAVINSTRTHESQVWPNPNEAPMLDPSRVTVPPYYPDTPVVRQDLARHYDNIARMDVWVGDILQRLEDDGLADSTIVFFFSDHGDGLPRAKRWPYDSGLHVPMVIRWPSHLTPGAVDDQLISFVDFAPTVLSLAGVPVAEHIQGQAFLGEQAAPPRSFIFAGRDRHDESYDMVRAVRDRRFKYIRHFHPERPYVVPNAYRDRMPLMQELLRMHRAGLLEGPQTLWFREARPPEELYDVTADPHEINNLADEPVYAAVLERMRGAMDQWRTEIDDLGEVPEAELVERFWPGRVQPETSAPVISVDRAAADTATLTLTSATEGASIAWTTEAGDNPHWLLYTAPVRLSVPATIRARAVRYGYRESEVAEERIP
jgi:N-sulfoglucosamine sulfohydrolase